MKSGVIRSNYSIIVVKTMYDSSLTFTITNDSVLKASHVASQ